MADHNIFAYPPHPHPTAPPPPSPPSPPPPPQPPHPPSSPYDTIPPPHQRYPPPRPRPPVIHADVSPTPPLPPPIPPPPDDAPSTTDLEKAEYRRLHTEKAVTTLSAGLLSILVISLSYVGVFTRSSDIYRITIAPLASSCVLIVIAIFASLYLCLVPGTLGKLALVPMVFAVVGGSMIILLNAAARASSEGGFHDIDNMAVLLSAGIFGGLGLGVTIGFVLFAGREEWQIPK